MNTPLTLTSLGAPLMALRLFADQFRHLPAPCISISTVYPNRLELSFHRDLDGFETWCQALGIRPVNVRHSVQGGGTTRVLRAETDYSGGIVILIGYTAIPAPDEARSRAEDDS
ncbi:hypothetical protein ADK90_02985 [Streptomyces sp. XY413]|uniref:hypothetical protein n=1 Tax=Streptomyces sp. XY413 TaxID=1519479 RepID=UPI0006AEA4EA|nr:hypothetical protein [Streptomyces sp. XY413]KOV27079.1 hypothetical protein ADK90_02985 [Streptomyces sp. XY413]